MSHCLQITVGNTLVVIAIVVLDGVGAAAVSPPIPYLPEAAGAAAAIAFGAVVASPLVLAIAAAAPRRLIPTLPC